MSRVIAQHLGQIDMAIRQCWQEWENNSRYQSQNGNGRTKAMIEWKGRTIVRAAVTAHNSLLANIYRVACPHIFNMIINTWLRERNFCSHLSLWWLLLTPEHCWVRLERWCARSTRYCADWGCIVFSDAFHFKLFPVENCRRVWRRQSQSGETALTITCHIGSQQRACLRRHLLWSPDSFDSHFWHGDSISLQWRHSRTGYVTVPFAEL